MRLRHFCSLVVLFLLVSCGSGGPGSPELRLVQIASGLDHPLLAISARDGTGRLFVVEQSGRIKVLPAGGGAPTVFLDLSGSVMFDRAERGLLGLVFHPQFAANRRFFVYYSRASDGASVLSEFRASLANPNVADPAEIVYITTAQSFPNHKGGDLHFGPDGFLYIAVGDGGSIGNPGPEPQSPINLLGKLLRIDVDRPAGGVPYSSPPDNPYFGSLSARNEIWAIGFRNPWRFAFDSADGRLIAADVGLNQREEIDVVTRGGNYGWPVWEGTLCTGFGPGPCDPAGFTMPIFEYSHDNGRCAVIGGFVYRGAAGTLPSGAYVFGDLCSSEVWRLQGNVQTLILRAQSPIHSFGQDESGEILVALEDGTIQRVSK